MIELGRHIEILLLNNDCVIIPDFGGFTTHHVCARYDETDNMFVPPLRTLGFNPQIQMNDSLLVHSYIDAYDISYPEAIRRIERETEELRHHIQTDGFFELNNIGTLSLNAEGNIEFTPSEAGVLTPDLYGLGAFEFKQQKAEKIQQLALPPIPKEAQQELPQEPEPVIDSESTRVLQLTDSEDEEEKTINIRVAWIRNIAAVAAAIVAFFLITTPISNSTDSLMQIGSIQPQVAVKNATDIIPVSETTPEIVEKKENPDVLNEPEVVKEQEDIQTKEYVVVMASQVSMANAQNYVEQLRARGYNSARIYEKKNTIRVVYGHFTSESQAYNAVNNLRDQAEFFDVWVYQIK